MEAARRKYSKTILLVGPRHSGKSTFSYLLFKQLRTLHKDEIFLCDCDVFSPTFRPYKFHSEEEEPFIRLPPGYDKMEEEISTEHYNGFLEVMLASINVKVTFILLDGIGRYTDKTELLMSKAKHVIALCKSDITDEELRKDGYIKEGNTSHPFQMFARDDLLKVTTSLSKITTSFNPGALDARVWGLQRESINRGDLSKVPQDSLQVVENIGRFISEKWG